MQIARLIVATRTQGKDVGSFRGASVVVKAASEAVITTKELGKAIEPL